MNILELYDIFLKYPKICTDSRKAEKGSIFFALRGDNFNGNQFVKKALEKCEYAIIDEKEYLINNKTILVENTLETLQILATYHRKRLGIPIMAITGTNGKTTTKELIIAVVSKKYKVTGTLGNCNNHIGVPLTLLRMTKNDEFGVVEMGANHIGEINKLCKIALPDFGIITNIGKAHLDGFGSFEGVKKAKSEMYNYLSETNGLGFVNADNEILEDLKPPKDVIFYGTKEFNHCQGKILTSDLFLKLKWFSTRDLENENQDIDWDNKNRIIQTKLIGNYNFENVLAAISVGNNFGISDANIKVAIENYTPKNNRSQLIQTNSNNLFADCYNANPASMNFSISYFNELEAKNKVVILGDMFELGNVSNREHGAVISLLEKYKFEQVFLIGKIFYEYIDDIEIDTKFFKTTQEAFAYFTNNKLENKTILIKGSRAIKLETLIELF